MTTTTRHLEYYPPKGYGRDKSVPYNPAHCAHEVYGGWWHQQCSRKSGWGPRGLFCRQHALKFATEGPKGWLVCVHYQTDLAKVERVTVASRSRHQAVILRPGASQTVTLWMGVDNFLFDTAAEAYAWDLKRMERVLENKRSDVASLEVKAAKLADLLAEARRHGH